MKKKQNNQATELSDKEECLVRKAIRLKGWTLARFARESKLALSTVQMILSRTRSPSQEARERMAAALGLDVNEPSDTTARIVNRKK